MRRAARDEPRRAEVSMEMPRENPRAVSEGVRSSRRGEDVGEMCDVLEPRRAACDEPCRVEVSMEMPRENPRAVSEGVRSSRRGEDGWRIDGR
ncbi:hypothetical protein NDU88_004862 [Pleurodeles waltl]|uniref:Uncharacterized protein n=1 Tax=Pleurodeles waltl TaxID=8319 RepID=A0AAV7WBL9_PLEWA|nr:hypothetical protein NDU88_004862 [Pleurodeles waltl]